MNSIERNELLTALYQATSKADLLNQFDSRLSEINAIFRERKTTSTKERRYTYLLEQIIFYSHAVIFGHGVQTAHNYRQAFMTTAKRNKSLKLSSEDIETAFSFLNRTEKKSIVKATSTEPQKQPNKDGLEPKGDCVAKSEINRLKAQLDNKSYELTKGQLSEDKEAFVKIALVTLSTGATQKDILEDIDLADYKPQSIELNTRTIKKYIKDVREHYNYIERAKALKEIIKRNPKNEDAQKSLRRVEPLANKLANNEDIDVSTGIRKALRSLGVVGATNTRGLVSLYRECLTSSTPK